MKIEGLNENQKNAVLTTEGPIMILAGAGSGKTRTLVSKISYLIHEKRVAPYHLLGLTFSNRAAKEMRNRISQITNINSGTLQVTTFHSFCARVLRSEFKYLGLGKNFTIYDKAESKSVVKLILEKRGISSKEISPLSILYYIDALKNDGYYINRQEKAMSTNSEEIHFIPNTDDEFYPYFLDYEAELLKSNAVDFGGLITGTLKLFEYHPEVLSRFQDRIKYILVDEFQDTNKAQFDLIFHLSYKHKNICVVGDEDQSIYSWRGANIRNILDFGKKFPHLNVIKLEQNYRSSKNIIEAASFVISKNQARSGKTMWTENPDGESLRIIECDSEKDEAHFVVTKIKELLDKKISPHDIAIFYRNNYQSRVLEEIFRKHKISFRVIGGIEFYQRKEIKDIISYLKLVNNCKDSLAFSRIVNVPSRGIGSTTLRKIEMLAIEYQVSLFEVVEKIIENPEKYSHLRLTSKIKSGLQELNYLINEGIRLIKEGQSLSFCFDLILKNSGYLEFLSAQKDYESRARIDNLKELASAIKQFEQSEENPTLSALLEGMAISGSNEINNSDGEVSMMTVHGSKGLEFPYVFIVGVEENLFPSPQSIEDSDLGLEEERRLFYVAMTRAMERLSISFSQSRMVFGQLKFNDPSRFLFELPEEKYSWEKWQYGDNFAGQRNDEHVVSRVLQRDSRSDKIKMGMTLGKFPDGIRINHSLYGQGVVLSTDGQGNNEKVLIQFRDGIKKKFMVQYAPLSIVHE